MIDNLYALSQGTQVRHYWIKSVVASSNDTITYHVEDMRLNRHMFLTEFFPKDIAKRFMEEDDTFMVYVHPTKNKSFNSRKTIWTDTAGKLKDFSHPYMSRVTGIFEANGTVYTVSNYIEGQVLQKSLQDNVTSSYTEEQICKFATSLTELLLALQHNGIMINSIQADMLYISKDFKVLLAGYNEFVPYSKDGTTQIIYGLGLLMYTMVNNNVPVTANSIKLLTPNSSYSILLCELINSMVSTDLNNRPKTLQEIKALLHNIFSEPVERVQPIVPNKPKTDLISLKLRLGALTAIMLFSIYLLFTQPQKMRVEDVTVFDTFRYHLVAYFGNSEALRALGQIYERGYSVEQDKARALEWYEKAAKNGDVFSQLHLGEIYHKGSISIKDDHRSIYWLTNASKQNSKKAKIELAQIYIEQKNKKKALELYLDLAKNGDAYAQKQAAYLMVFAEGEKDFKSGYNLFLKNAQKGDASSQYALGFIYENGKGVHVDHQKALHWYEKADQQGYKAAKERISYLKNKNNTNKVPKYNETWASRSFDPVTSQQIDASEQYHIARSLEYGINGIQKDEKKALQHYLNAANRGHIQAQYKVGRFYQQGKGTQQNHHKSLYWFKKAAAQNDVYAYYEISKLYYANKEIPKDEKKAFMWCEKAAIGGLGVAQGMLGARYEYGWGVGINYKKALYWYEKSVVQGYNNGKTRLEKLKRKLHIR
ncbi:Sel1-like repeat-containing protein kinase family protein [Sulfurovum sp. AR]|uniref:Sel1-like repeat-containing protein kinase family protein n=1 Tax=Sulfurovum sp. AR TaxID=1165841 RepID=UPI00025C4C83|nr:Sel1-like repeat-containing protein kinase family protein [Sulfurovum sp. AR]EIF51991.1 hypothetical protein SULAR_00750 [Sulfurovum sp. AR]